MSVSEEYKLINIEGENRDLTYLIGPLILESI